MDLYKLTSSHPYSICPPPVPTDLHWNSRSDNLYQLLRKALMNTDFVFCVMQVFYSYLLKCQVWFEDKITIFHYTELLIYSSRFETQTAVGIIGYLIFIVIWKYLTVWLHLHFSPTMIFFLFINLSWPGLPLKHWCIQFIRIINLLTEHKTV